MTIYIADKFAELEKLLQTIEEIPALNILGPLEIQSGGFYIRIGSIIKEEMFIFCYLDLCCFLLVISYFPTVKFYFTSQLFEGFFFNI